MKKKIFIALCLFIFLPAFVLAKPKEITLKVNGKVVKPDVAPFLFKNRTYVPVRFIAENLGMKVDYSYDEFFKFSPEDDGLVVTLKGNKEELIEINPRGVYRSGINFDIDAYPYIVKKNRTFLPVRFIADALHMDVYWDQETKTIDLITNHTPEIYDVMIPTRDPNNPYEYVRTHRYSMVYDGEEYLLCYHGENGEDHFLPFDVFYDKVIESRIEKGFDIWESEEFLFGANCCYIDFKLKKAYIYGCN